MSKSACLFLVNLFFITVTFLTALGLNAVLGGFFFYNKAVDMLFYVFCIWMVSNGFSALILMICMITRSKAAGVAGAFILCSGLIVLLVSSLLNLFGAGEIMNYTLYMNLAGCPLGYDGLSALGYCRSGLLCHLCCSRKSDFNKKGCLIPDRRVLCFC